MRRPLPGFTPTDTLLPYTTLFRSTDELVQRLIGAVAYIIVIAAEESDAKARYIHRPPLRSESAEGQERRWRQGKPLQLPIAKGVLSWRNCLCALKRCWSGFQHLFAVTKRAASSSRSEEHTSEL